MIEALGPKGVLEVLDYIVAFANGHRILQQVIRHADPAKAYSRLTCTAVAVGHAGRSQYEPAGGHRSRFQQATSDQSRQRANREEADAAKVWFHGLGWEVFFPLISALGWRCRNSARSATARAALPSSSRAVVNSFCK